MKKLIRKIKCILWHHEYYYAWSHVKSYKDKKVKHDVCYICIHCWKKVCRIEKKDNFNY